MYIYVIYMCHIMKYIHYSKHILIYFLFPCQVLFYVLSGDVGFLPLGE